MYRFVAKRCRLVKKLSSFAAGPTRRHLLKCEGALIHHPCACIIIPIIYTFSLNFVPALNEIDAALELRAEINSSRDVYLVINGMQSVSSYL